MEHRITVSEDLLYGHLAYAWCSCGWSTGSARYYLAERWAHQHADDTDDGHGSSAVRA